MPRVKDIFDKRYKHGLSLLEIIVGMTLTVIALLAMFELLQMSLNVSYRAQQEIIAINLARGLMGEITSRNFWEAGMDCGSVNLGRDNGETVRSDFDDVDDYNGWFESPPQYPNGTLMNGLAGTLDYTGFNRSVEVRFVDENLQDSGCSDFKLISVTVQGPYVRPITLRQVRSKLE